ncbi:MULTISPECIES: phenylalanine--tRNA ligase subunit alpha [Cetobacterium]|jgi:phenylalanyl-tRNA synthetase alpha chain|uniref:Phenylalanine--tRNA ligase alpha subunit n=1 Tax=Candidatus Cetobacterium colombiensis TaxID=3073100 RepID=A0ABU4WC09_9FUSO|nr:phenylalanine--tRNA ligase subunit alpha [Candidatus Cetobacterium colombiensis]MDX8337067.1 phenylalanine--tRNA ligase subunit alpha [Candidatus Cetobacterium colombiensis]
MKNKLNALKDEASLIIQKATTLQEIDEIRVKYLGKKGEFTEVSKSMRDLSPEERPAFGQMVNEVKNTITTLIEEKTNEIKEKVKKEQLESETLDISLPGKTVSTGGLHPITETMNFLKNIFVEMGFDVAEGPEVEFTSYNFDALNIPETHPSRDLQDTFYMSENVVLRTHTSPVQARYMEKHQPPFRMVCPGKVYRNDYDISHTPMFHQMEGLMVGPDVSFANLKAMLEQFVTRVFGETKVRFRPHFFPFTEPSAEMDVQCVICKGEGCRLCKHSGWLEIMGCGMVDPAVLGAVGYDSEEVSGFAFGMGIERITMLRYGIDDLRAFFENDVRFLKQFK